MPVEHKSIQRGGDAGDSSCFHIRVCPQQFSTADSIVKGCHRGLARTSETSGVAFAPVVNVPRYTVHVEARDPRMNRVPGDVIKHSDVIKQVAVAKVLFSINRPQQVIGRHREREVVVVVVRRRERHHRSREEHSARPLY